MLADDEEVLAIGEPDETIQIHGTDRKYPCVVRRKSYAVDSARSTIQTISGKRGKFTYLYAAYADEIQDYIQRRESTTRRHSTRHSKSVGKVWAMPDSVGKEQSANPSDLRSQPLDRRIETEIMLAKSVGNEKQE